MRAEDVYIGQVVRYKDWEELSKHWKADKDGDLYILNSNGALLNYAFRFEVEKMRDVNLVVEDIEGASEGCYVLLDGINPNDQVESFWVHCYKLDPVEQEDISFDETGFLSMLGVKEG